MMDEKIRSSLVTRLNRIGGQISGIKKMIEDNKYCIDILNQSAAAISALKSVENLIVENHLNTCVKDAMRSNDPQEQNEKIDEMVEIIGRFNKSR